ncbi:MAG: DUF348 domain-containing protein [Actinomycetaceae bacterium]|nr:DUF348 domain-containing protein [Actinomycetaceae bacterium]
MVDGEELTLTTTSGTTVAQALEDAGIELGELDEVSLPLNTRLESNVTITIVRVTTALVSEDFEVEYETVREDDSSLAQGTEKVETEGQNGVGTRTYTVYYRDGEEANWEMTVEAVTTQPVNEVIRVGTRTSSSSSSGGSFTPPANAAPVAPGTSRAIAAEMVAARGWSESEFACLDTLWQRESGWNHLAMNPYSGAYGIPQSLPGSKMASAGADWQTNPATQIAWGLSYISGRYGTPCGALSHSYSVGWY